VLFTDLDGTVLDNEDYSYESSINSIRTLKEHDVPVVFCSSKTKCEQEIYRWLLRVFDPFIVEDGSAIYIPRGYFNKKFEFDRAWGPYQIILLGARYDDIRKTIDGVEESTGIRSFGSMSPGEISEITGLDREFANIAKDREYSETILVEDEDAKNISDILHRSNLTMSRGGKFWIVRGQTDKGKAVKKLKSIYKNEFGDVMTIGVGDSFNDLPMLENVDRPFLIKNGNINDEIIQDINIIDRFEEIVDTCL